MLAAAANDLKRGERISEQRLSLGWTGLAEVHYRYRGEAYRIWIPERADATPIALEHPLSSTPAPAAAPAEQPLAPGAEVSRPEPALVPASASNAAAEGVAAKLSWTGWMKSLGFWVAIVVVAGSLVAWIVNWKP